MPAVKYTYFTPTDDEALGAILQDVFPSLLICDYTYTGPDTYREFDTLSDALAQVDWPTLIVRPKGWRFRMRKHVFSEKRRGYIASNLPDETMTYWPSRFVKRQVEPDLGEETALSDGILQIGMTDRMTDAQKRLQGKVWRLLKKIGTDQLLGWFGPAGQVSWKMCPGRMWIAGNDAVRWAMEDERRYFLSNGCNRPVSDPPPAAGPILPWRSKPRTNDPEED